MAGSSLLALIDDIATLLDDVALMTKTAAKKTAGVLGDDLALNAEQVSGVNADREIPVVVAVAKGSLVNKMILVPVALLISAFIPWLVTPLLMLGGAFLCYEGVEKIADKFLYKHSNEPRITPELLNNRVNLVTFEKNKIKGAIRTDFILSAEIIVITLSTVAAATFMEQLTVLAIVAVLITVGVYGLVAGIVRLDDLGLFLSRKEGELTRNIGNGIVRSAPYLMKTLSVVGTIAMFIVGGGILTHGLTQVHHVIDDITMAAEIIPNVGALLGGILPTLLNIGFGILTGAIVLILMTILEKIKNAFSAKRAK